MTTNQMVPVVGSRWLRNSAEVRGKGLHVVVLYCDAAKVGEREYVVVRYRHEATKRTGSMPLEDFVRASNFLPPLPAPDAAPIAAPQPTQLALPLAEMAAWARVEAKLDHLLAMANTGHYPSASAFRAAPLSE